MSDTTILKRLLKEASLVELEDHYPGKKKVTLREPQADDSYLEVFNVPQDSIVIDLDRAFSNSNFYIGSQGECKRADFIIISEYARKILFIELKKSNEKLHYIIKQLKGALCAFEYTQSIVKHFFDENNFLDNYEKRFISVTRTTPGKRKTSIEKDTKVHNSPDEPLALKWTTSIQFNKIAS